MEVVNFINILKRHKYALLAIPLLVMLLTFVLVRHQPNTYESKARISAGILDGSQQFLANKDNQGETKINQQFSNLLQMLQLKMVVDQVSYLLMIHDLTSDTPFKKSSKLLGQINVDARTHAIKVYSEKYKTRQPLSTTDKDQEGLITLIKSMGYDFESLKNKFKIWRVESSDYIDVGYEAESPELAAYVINTLCNEFINYYTASNLQNGSKAIDYLGALLKEKKDALNAKMQDLKEFKIKNRVLNLNEQAKSLYGQMADFETRKEITEKDIASTTGALGDIDSKFSTNGRQYIEGKQTDLNLDIVATRQQLEALNSQYVQSNFDPVIKDRLDSIKQTLASQINASTDKVMLNPLTAKDNLLAQKLKLSVDLQLAKNSTHSLDQEITKLNHKFDLLVPNEAVIQAYEEDISVASQEYIEILKKYNQTSMDLNATSKIKQIEIAPPGTLQPSKKMVLVILSGIVAFVVYIVILFVLFYFDESIKVSSELANKTNIPVLGYLPLIKASHLDVKELWDNTQRTHVSAEFKNLLRSIRFELDMVMHGGRLLAVTSIRPGEGKTLFTISLASAYLMINKRVLVIDGNFNDPAITEITNTKYFIEDYLTGKAAFAVTEHKGEVHVLGNRGSDTSVLEISDEQIVKQKLLELKDYFDIIIVETPDLIKMNLAKEWIEVVDRVVGVFESNRSIKRGEEENIAFLKTLNNKFTGWVLNKVTNERVKVTNKKSFFMKNVVS
jgi:succinoglycan biosynthesis transport protein ExoP